MAVYAEQRLYSKFLINKYLTIEAYMASFFPTLNHALPKEYWPAYIQTLIVGVLILNPSLLQKNGSPSRCIHNEMDVRDRR
ncbi:hypothetical protein LguiA_022201 [Lonicera macranthoides]